MFVNHFVEAVFATRVDLMMVTTPARLSNVTSVLRFGTIWENEFQIKIKMTITVMSLLMISTWIIAGTVHSSKMKVGGPNCWGELTE